MDGAQRFLNDLREKGLAEGNFLAILHVLIGRKVTLADGTTISPGLTWRAAAELLKSLRWPKEAVRELGVDPGELPPRDRQRFWYTTIALAKVDSPQAIAAGDRLAAAVTEFGYRVSPAPSKG